MKFAVAVVFLVVCTGFGQWSSDPGVFLEAVSPNPLASADTVLFSVTEGGYVTLGLCDLTGRVVGLVTDGFYPSGNHTVVIDTDNIPSGMYILRLDAMGESVSRACLLLR